MPIGIKGSDSLVFLNSRRQCFWKEKHKYTCLAVSFCHDEMLLASIKPLVLVTITNNTFRRRRVRQCKRPQIHENFKKVKLTELLCFIVVK